MPIVKGACKFFANHNQEFAPPAPSNVITDFALDNSLQLYSNIHNRRICFALTLNPPELTPLGLID